MKLETGFNGRILVDQIPSFIIMEVLRRTGYLLQDLQKIQHSQCSEIEGQWLLFDLVVGGLIVIIHKEKNKKILVFHIGKSLRSIKYSIKNFCRLFKLF